MAVMSAAQTTAELQRKKNLNVAPTSSANLEQYKKLTAAPNSVGVAKAGTTGGNTAVVKQSYTPPAYGSNVAGFDANNSNHTALADAGKQYADAVARGDRAGMDAARTLGDTLRAQNGVNEVYDSKGGVTSFIPQEVAKGPEVNVSGSSIPQAYTPSYTGPDMTGMTAQLESMFGNRLSSETAKLREALATALQGYNAQETQTKQAAYSNRNASDVTSSQNDQAMREQLANMGMTGDGQNLTLQAAQGASRLGSLSDINQNESNALLDILQKRSGLQNNAANQELALTQQVGSDKAAALYDLLKYGDTRKFDVEQYNYGRYQDNVDNQYRNDAFNWQKQTDTAGLTGQFNGQKTSDQAQRDWENRFNYGQATGTFGNGQQTLQSQLSVRDFNYQVGRDDVADSQWVQEFNAAVKQNGIQNAMAQVKAGSSGSGSSGGTKDLSLAQKISIWKISGQAPEGIPGVTPGTKVYDEVAARKAAETSGGVKLWDAIKGVINSVAGGSSGMSDEDISNYLK